MARTYSDTPEPRYVEKAKFAENAKGGKPASYLTVSNVYAVEKGFRVAYDVNGEEAEIEVPLEGTDDVIVDVDEANLMINVHLDAATRTKIGKALVLPAEAPANVALVGVGTNNAQTMLSVGEGLAVEGSTLKASGGGGNEVWVTTFHFKDKAKFDEYFINIFSSTALWQSTSAAPEDWATSDSVIIEALSKVDLPTAVQTGYAYRHTSSSNAPTQMLGIPRLISYTGTSFISNVTIAYMSQNGIYTASFDPETARTWSSRKVQ